MKKFIVCIIALLFLAVGQPQAKEWYLYNRDGKELTKGFVYKQDEDYFYAKYLVQRGVHKVSETIYRYYKFDRKQWIKDHRVTYPKFLDTFQPPTRIQITRNIMTDCLYKKYTPEEKLEIVDGIIKYWKKQKIYHEKLKKRVYYMSPTVGTISVIDEKGRTMNAALIALGVGVATIRQTLKNGKRVYTTILMAPFCNDVRNSVNVINTRN